MAPRVPAQGLQHRAEHRRRPAAVAADPDYRAHVGKFSQCPHQTGNQQVGLAVFQPALDPPHLGEDR